jgi:hypothetical protein
MWLKGKLIKITGLHSKNENKHKVRLTFTVSLHFSLHYGQSSCRKDSMEAVNVRRQEVGRNVGNIFMHYS